MFKKQPKEQEVQKKKATLTEEITEAWKASYRIVFKDLPRIAVRSSLIHNSICLVEKGTQKKTFKDSSAIRLNEKDLPSSDLQLKLSESQRTDEKVEEPEEKVSKGTWKYVKVLLKNLATVLDGEENGKKFGEIATEFDTDSYDLYEATESSLTKYYGTKEKLQSSKVFAVLRLMTQEMIFPGLAAIIFNLLDSKPMNDVRSKDGWHIKIDIHDPIGKVPRSIQIIHTRKMQSLQKNTPKWHQVEWQLYINLNSSLTDVVSARLKVTGIEYHKDATAEIKSEIRRKFLGGDCIV